jgi:hypothetical protein
MIACNTPELQDWWDGKNTMFGELLFLVLWSLALEPAAHGLLHGFTRQTLKLGML